jgi:hypothetical protein
VCKRRLEWDSVCFEEKYVKDLIQAYREERPYSGSLE